MTDPFVFDSGADPDNDGSNNANERQRGKHPGDPDSDDDGEADGTDPNLVDSAVPLIQPPSIYAYPGDETVYVRYTIADTYQFVGLFRDEDDDMDELYTFLGQQVAPNLAGEFTDTLVMNAHQYCYVAAAIDFDGRRSTFSAPSCAVPNTDPLPQRGSVLINDGAQSTASPHVNLALWASDTVDPEMHDFGPDYLPPDDSASGVTDMMVSNNPDFGGAAWEPYGTSKPWTLAQTSGLATVYAKYMDAAGNVSETYAATIWIGQNPASKSLYVPLIVQAP